jgi:DNA-binding MarR family transcriptional regulator
MHPNALDLPAAGSCTCSKLRGLARRVTGLYDAALAPHRVTVTQYAALATMARSGAPIPVAQLARRLQMDRTTTSRLVGPLEAEGLVVRVDARKSYGDARARPLQLTAKGRRRLAGALPAWQAAQRDLAAILGEGLSTRLHRATEAATHALVAASIEPTEPV